MVHTRSETSLSTTPSGRNVVEGTDQATHVKLGARLGVWGLVGGFGVMTAFTLGAPLSLGVAIGTMGAGLVASGVGTVLASMGVLRKQGSVPRIIKIAAALGLPLGGLLGVLGVTSLTQWGPLVAIVNALTPTAGIFGAAVILLLAAGFLAGRSHGDRDESFAEDHDGGTG